MYGPYGMFVKLEIPLLFVEVVLIGRLKTEKLFASLNSVLASLLFELDTAPELPSEATRLIVPFKNV